MLKKKKSLVMRVVNLLRNCANGLEASRRDHITRKMQAGVSYAEFHSTIASFFGDLCDMNKNDFGTTIQRVNDLMNAKFNDYGVVMSNLFEDTQVRLKDYTRSHFSIVNQRIDASSEQSDAVSKKRHHRTAEFIFGLLEHQQMMELNADNRHLELMERFRLQDTRIEEMLAITMSTNLETFQRITEIIDRSNSTKPSLEWFIDNAFELAEFGNAMRHIKDNSLPRNIAAGLAAKNIIALIDTDYEAAVAAMDAKIDQIAA